MSPHVNSAVWVSAASGSVNSAVAVTVQAPVASADRVPTSGALFDAVNSSAAVSETAGFAPSSALSVSVYDPGWSQVTVVVTSESAPKVQVPGPVADQVLGSGEVRSSDAEPAMPTGVPSSPA